MGRLPIIATLDGLTREALVDIVTKPKNALIKQYKKLVELDGVELVFSDDAIDAIVDKALERNTGARGLRSIIEDIMRDIMYDIPSNEKIVKCTITKDTAESIKPKRKSKQSKKEETA